MRCGLISYPGVPDFSAFPHYWAEIGGGRHYQAFESVANLPPAKGVWADDTGWLRFHDPINREDWRLRSLNGKPMPFDSVPLPVSSLSAAPAKGVRWIWE